MCINAHVPWPRLFRIGNFPLNQKPIKNISVCIRNDILDNVSVRFSFPSKTVLSYRSEILERALLKARETVEGPWMWMESLVQVPLELYPPGKAPLLSLWCRMNGSFIESSVGPQSVTPLLCPENTAVSRPIFAIVPRTQQPLLSLCCALTRHCNIFYV